MRRACSSGTRRWTLTSDRRLIPAMPLPHSGEESARRLHAVIPLVLHRAPRHVDFVLRDPEVVPFPPLRPGLRPEPPALNPPLDAAAGDAEQEGDFPDVLRGRHGAAPPIAGFGFAPTGNPSEPCAGGGCDGPPGPPGA